MQCSINILAQYSVLRYRLVYFSLYGVSGKLDDVHLRVLGLELPSTSFRTSQDQQTVRLNINDVEESQVGDAGVDEESS